jgi:hypothetical protein
MLPDENFGLDRFEQGFLVMATILKKLSEKSTSSPLKTKSKKSKALAKGL